MRDVLAARRRIRPHVYDTPLRRSAWLSSAASADVHLKLECVQRTGSFKIRGALNALMQIEAAHVVTASAGNHGRAVALAAEMLGHRATVFAPRDAPQAKLAAIERHGADLRRETSYDEAEAAARQYAQRRGHVFVSPYNHPDVIAGAGTMALEIIEADPAVDTIVVPVGGGGLISGVAIVAKTISPHIRVVGVEVEASNAFTVSLRNGRVTVIDPQPTLADGLAGNMDAETITFGIVRRYVDEIVTIGEDELADAVRGLAGEEHVVAEGAGAAAPAAVLAGKAGRSARMAALVTGANIDLARLREVISAGSTTPRESRR